MGVRKGTDNFKQSRDAKQEANVRRLSAELKKARSRKVSYPDERALIYDMADRVGIDRTTLKRNGRYYQLLLAFLAAQAGGPALLTDKDAPPEILRAKLIDADMEIGQLRYDLSKAKASAAKVNDTSALTSSAAHAAFADTVWVLREVIERVNADGETLVIDLQRGEIRDLSAPPSRQVVVSGARVRPFMDAYRSLLHQEGLA